MRRCTYAQLWCRLVARASAPAKRQENGALRARSSDGKGQQRSSSLVTSRMSLPVMTGGSFA